MTGTIRTADKGRKPDALDESGETLDELVTLSQVAPLAALSKRTLERYVKDGKLPEPDFRGGGGKAHKWYWRTLRPTLAEIVNPKLPERFSGSRII